MPDQDATQTELPEVWQIVSGVRIWRFGLDADPPTVEEMRRVLSPDETSRADRFVTDRLRTHYTVARATLRTILSGCIGNATPAKIAFTYGSHGKPSIKSPSTESLGAEGLWESAWRFNLSHSRNMALLAVCYQRELGVDIEGIDDRIEIEDIAARFFTEDECAEMMALQPIPRREKFFDLWCCKEAYLKAVGTGISGGLNKCSLKPITASEMAVHNPDEGGSLDRWRIHRLKPGTGYAGALCVSNPVPE